MHRRLLWLVAFVLLVVPVRHAEAWQFGTQEDIHFIQDVSLKGAQDEALYLGYMTKTSNFLAGYSLTDEGYVLGVKGESSKFYPIPKDEELARFQKAGTLPSPLPPYQLGAFDYVMGYSLYWVILFVVGWFVVSSLIKRRKAESMSTQG
jgi:hypothetical protein